jgi:flagellar hook-length control protein FliK
VLVETNPAILLSPNAQKISSEVETLAAELTLSEVHRTELEEVNAALNGRTKTVRVALKPEGLGDVVVKVHSRQDSLRVEVQVQSDDAGRSLLPEIDAIAGALSGLGLTLDQFTLTAPGGGITMLQAPAERSSGAMFQSQNSPSRERQGGEQSLPNPERRDARHEEAKKSSARGIYI